MNGPRLISTRFLQTRSEKNGSGGTRHAQVIVRPLLPSPQSFVALRRGGNQSDATLSWFTVNRSFEWAELAGEGGWLSLSFLVT
jgi:hypothetical protein